MEQYADPTAGIEANDLLIFARVADLGSFSRAAERLGLPKSTVSRRVAWLESHLGERLLLRTTRRQTLTEFGSLLLERAVDALQLSARSLHRILRVARTIADLDGSDSIDTDHLTEAIGYRRLERGIGQRAA